MSDSAGGGEGGGASGAGQDSEADGEPPQQAPPSPDRSEWVERETAEDGVPPSAKRSRRSEGEQGLHEVHDETTAESGSAQENSSSPAQGELPQPEGEDGRDEAITVAGDVTGCRQNGDAGPDAAEEEPRQEEERDVDEAAGSPAPGQHPDLDFTQNPSMLTGSWTEYSNSPENYLKGCKW